MKNILDMRLILLQAKQLGRNSWTSSSTWCMSAPMDILTNFYKTSSNGLFKLSADAVTLMLRDNNYNNIIRLFFSRSNNFYDAAWIQK